MDFIKTAIKRPVTVFVMISVVLILGIVSISKMKMAMLPDVDLPVAIVMTEYKGAGPEEVESLVTDKIEGAVSNVENIDTVSSTSSDGQSLVVVNLNYGADLDKAVSSMRDKISMIEGTLPEDVETPTIMKIDLNAEAVANIVVSSESMSNDALKTFAEDVVKDRLERQSGVSSVEITGGNEKEIRIEVDPERLEGLGLSMTAIGQILASENTNMPGGVVDYGENTITISSQLKMKSIEDIKGTPVKLNNGTVLQLQDFANITETNKKVSSISRFNGESCINIAVTKASDANTVTTVREVIKDVNKLSKANPNVEIKVISESGTEIEDSVKSVIKNIIIGAVLSIIVLFVF